jgi:hypothetical protein
MTETLTPERVRHYRVLCPCCAQTQVDLWIRDDGDGLETDAPCECGAGNELVDADRYAELCWERAVGTLEVEP